MIRLKPVKNRFYFVRTENKNEGTQEFYGIFKSLIKCKGSYKENIAEFIIGYDEREGTMYRVTKVKDITKAKEIKFSKLEIVSKLNRYLYLKNDLTNIEM